VQSWIARPRPYGITGVRKNAFVRSRLYATVGVKQTAVCEIKALRHSESQENRGLQDQGLMAQWESGELRFARSRSYGTVGVRTAVCKIKVLWHSGS